MNTIESGGPIKKDKETSPIEKERKIIFLTPLHVDILNCSARGLSNKQIGLELHKSKRVIRNHFLNIYIRLGVDEGSRLQANLLALQLGIIDRKKNLEGFDPTKFDLLTKPENEVLQKMTENGGKQSSYTNLAKTLTLSENTIKSRIRSILQYVGETDMTGVTTRYALLKKVPTQNQDIVCIQGDNRRENKDNFTKQDIRLLLTISRTPLRKLGKVASENGKRDLANLIQKVREKIGTLPRLEALVEGLNKGLIWLPPREETQIVDVNKLLKNSLVIQLLSGISSSSFPNEEI